MAEQHKGACLCGAVTFAITGPLESPDACHCSQCRKQSGHYWAAIAVQRAALTITGADSLNWYRSSPDVQRGFCRTCGSFLFWDGNAFDTVDVAMGAFDTPTGQRLRKHIFVADKGDYYEIGDGLPQQGA